MIIHCFFRLHTQKSQYTLSYLHFYLDDIQKSYIH